MIFRNVIEEFMSARNKVAFYNSAIDGTLCVEWFDAGVCHTSTAENLAKRIIRFKRENLAKGL